MDGFRIVVFSAALTYCMTFWTLAWMLVARLAAH